MNDELEPIIHQITDLRIKLQKLNSWNDDKLYKKLKPIHDKMVDVELDLLVLWKEYFP